MDFPIIDLLDEELSVAWLMKHFHPDGLKWVHCQHAHSGAQFFRANRGSGLPVYRCHRCQGIYHLHSGTVFEGCQLTPSQVVLLLRGFVQGQSSAQLSRELGLAYKTILQWRRRVQANAERLQPNTPLADEASESDELFQNGGKKGVEHFDPLDPPRRRANKQRGRGTFANDRPPVLGTIGRDSGQVRLRVAADTKQVTLREHVERFTDEGIHIYTDEYDSYNTVDRPRSTVAHEHKEWARDDDGDGFREVHTKAAEGMWSGL
jgi:transposase-like protein